MIKLTWSRSRQTVKICQKFHVNRFLDKLFEIVKIFSTVETYFLPVSRLRVSIETTLRQIETCRLSLNLLFLEREVIEKSLKIQKVSIKKYLLVYCHQDKIEISQLLRQNFETVEMRVSIKTTSRQIETPKLNTNPYKLSQVKLNRLLSLFALFPNRIRETNVKKIFKAFLEKRNMPKLS
jgi:hypothetical protein